MGPEKSGQGTSGDADSEAGVRDPEQGIPRANLETFVDLHQNAVPQKPKREPVRNILIQQLTPELLHGNWAWIKRGAEDIIQRIRPRESSSWIVEDLYAALRYPEASHQVLWMVSRNQKGLGWLCGCLNKDQYGKLEFVVWDAWDLPLNEREERDDVEGARDQLMEYVRAWAKMNGAWRIVTYSYRKLEAVGWTKSHTTYYMTV